MNKHTWEYQNIEFMAWRSDYIVRFEPMVGKFIRAGCPLFMQVRGRDSFVGEE